MPGIFPNTPFFPSLQTENKPTCAWIVPALMSKRDYARTCRALPPGMPDCLEVRVARFEEGVERSTAVVYGTRVYLIHYEFKTHGDG